MKARTCVNEHPADLISQAVDMLDFVSRLLGESPEQVELNARDCAGFGYIMQHKDVLETIRAIEIPEEFSGRNFPPAESAGQTDPFVAEAYTDQQGKWRPMYRMTRDGFTFLVMGFTGEKAALAKETAPPVDCQLVPTAEYIGLLKEKIAWLEGRGQETVKRPPRLPLSQDEVAEIRRLKGLGHSLREVAGLTGRSRATVSLVCRGLRQEVAR